MMPGFMLKRMLLLNLPEDPQHSAVADSIDFVVEQVRFVYCFSFSISLSCVKLALHFFLLLF